MHLDIRRIAQALAQVLDVVAEVGEVPGDRQLPVGDHVHALRLPRAREPEDLGQGHAVPVALIEEVAEDDQKASASPLL
ncbi:hypothetical protein [Halorhodospira neutriphila]|uniref:hypothetical protein n=1 Tax=Halorhodospira neutriphila TaxID=168379 RepID=UPI001903CED8|nr:hypothetical protein [Halorhodospira neutriphila]